MSYVLGEVRGPRSEVRPIKIESIPNLCQLIELDLSCFGCCGNHFEDKSDLKRDIRLNTKRYQEKKNELGYLKHISKDLRSSGICKLVIYIDGENVGCPLHPQLNSGLDLRAGHCDIEYNCTTKSEFESWDKKTRMEFIDYIIQKNLDKVEYSIKMAGGSLLGGFRRRKR